MRKQLYLECTSGISGDMTVAALLDLGADETVLRKALASLPVSGYRIAVTRVKKAGLDCCDFNVILDEAHENHDHDMAYLFGSPDVSVHDHAHNPDHVHPHDHGHPHDVHDHDHEHHHDHGHDGDHPHDHGHDHEHPHDHSHGHHHAHRGLNDIIGIISRGDLTPGARDLAVRIFTILAEAESKAHGVPVEQVHFHEVGAVDSIVDIVAAAVCLDNLGADRVFVPELWEGGGTIRCQHGIIPVPVPAVTFIAAAHHLPLHLTGKKGEWVTPTGAAIAAAVRTTDPLPQRLTIEKIGLGAGKRTYEQASIVRAMLIADQTGDHDQVIKLETNVDDCTGEALGYVMEKLLAAGARDVHYIPVLMKKNRPAYELVVIASPKDVDRLEKIIFAETTTIGIRRCAMDRTVLKRRSETVKTPLGPVTVKICDLPDGPRVYPEYSGVIALCAAHHLSYQEVYHQVIAAYQEAHCD